MRIKQNVIFLLYPPLLSFIMTIMTFMTSKVKTTKNKHKIEHKNICFEVSGHIGHLGQNQDAGSGVGAEMGTGIHWNVSGLVFVLLTRGFASSNWAIWRSFLLRVIESMGPIYNLT
jgi:hypothetical protein